MLLAMYRLLRLPGIALVGIVEQPQHELHAQHIRHPAIDGLHGDLALTDCLTQGTDKVFGHREIGAHVQPGIHRLSSALHGIDSHSVLRVEELHCLAVRNHIAFETPFVTKDFRQKAVTARNGLAIVIVIRAHHAQRACLTKCLAKRLQIERPHLARRHMRVRAGAFIAASHRNAIHGKVLGSGNQPFRLKPFNHPLAQLAHQVGVFAVTLHHTSPSGVLGNIQYGGIDIGIAQRLRLFRRHPGYFANQLLVPRSPLPALCRKHGGTVVAKPSDAFVGKVHRYAQARLFHKPALDGLPVFHTVHVRIGQRRAELPQTVCLFVDVGNAVLPDFLLPLRRGQRVFQHTTGSIEGCQLARLLLQRHLRQEVVYPRLQRCRRVFVNIHHPILIEVYPPLLIDTRLIARIHADTKSSGKT